MPDAPRLPRIAFQGERGAYSEEAALLLFGPQIELVPRPTFAALFTAVEEGAADRLLVPIENSIAGSIHQCYDLLLSSSLAVTAEVIVPIAHCLIGPPGASLVDVEQVQSHPAALAQCEGFFRGHPHLRRVAVDDTAGSVREVVERRDRSRAAIAGLHAARIYRGSVLREHIEDHRENYTRFLLLGPAGPPAAGANKLSLVLELAHQPGALHRALAVFARRDINLMKIESRPVLGRPWHYRFYVDLEAAAGDAAAESALSELEPAVEHMRVLGWYPAATVPAAHAVPAEGKA